MKKIIVGIEGLTPLLMHNPAGMSRGGGGRKLIPPPEEEAAAGRYLMPDGKTLALKADHIHQCVIVGSQGYRLRGRESVVPYISGSLEIVPDLISLGTTKYTVDVRRAVVKKDGVLRARPLIWPWKATFELHYDEEVFAEVFLGEVLRDQIFKRAGRAVGLLEYRPAKRGKFGRFYVVRWQH